MSTIQSDKLKGKVAIVTASTDGQSKRKEQSIISSLMLLMSIIIISRKFQFLRIGAYSVSKTALLGLTKAIANETASSNIRVNCICSGITKTKFSRALWENEGINEEMDRIMPNS
uniref:Uncharacterized protein n=1 Tax=Tetranychus urticae TaxID=32264 RepID=T1KNI8_TETUR